MILLVFSFAIQNSPSLSLFKSSFPSLRLFFCFSMSPTLLFLLMLSFQHSQTPSTSWWWPFPLLHFFGATHSSGGQHGRVVVDVCDSDDGGSCVGEAKVQVALHVSGLHDDGVLGHFLWKTENNNSVWLLSAKAFLAIKSSTTDCDSQRKKKRAEPVFGSTFAVRGHIWNTAFKGEVNRVETSSVERIQTSYHLKAVLWSLPVGVSSKTMLIQSHWWTDVKTMIQLTEINRLSAKQ